LNFVDRRGVSPIIATLLLIAIAVAAGIVVYVFVNGFAGNLTTGGGQQTTERLQMQSYNFQLSPQTCACVGQILQVFVVNSGSASTTISAVYLDGSLLTVTTIPDTSTHLISAINTNAYTAPTSTLVNDYTTTCTSTNGAASSLCFTATTAKTTYATGDVGQVVIPVSPAMTPGTSHTVKIVSSTGATFVFSVTAGRVG
jgi:flagellin-like protein